MSTTSPETMSTDCCFPKHERVAYQTPPLAEVICQIRFPPILRIESELPSEFQERIRDRYPLFVVESNNPTENLPPDIKKIVSSLPDKSEDKVYKFRSEDQKWQISLGRDFISISTTNYTRWSEFNHDLVPALEAIVDIYKPSYFSRIGLRYIDFIDRGKLGVENTPWRDLLAPHIAAALACDNMETSIKATNSTTTFEAEPGSSCMATIRHGLGEFASNTSREREGYILDFDFFTEQKVTHNESRAILEKFNEYAGRSFRWCISDRLHEAMSPVAN